MREQARGHVASTVSANAGRLRMEAAVPTLLQRRCPAPRVEPQAHCRDEDTSLPRPGIAAISFSEAWQPQRGRAGSPPAPAPHLRPSSSRLPGCHPEPRPLHLTPEPAPSTYLGSLLSLSAFGARGAGGTLERARGQVVSSARGRGSRVGSSGRGLRPVCEGAEGALPAGGWVLDSPLRTDASSPFWPQGGLAPGRSSVRAGVFFSHHGTDHQGWRAAWELTARSGAELDPGVPCLVCMECPGPPASVAGVGQDRGTRVPLYLPFFREVPMDQARQWGPGIPVVRERPLGSRPFPGVMGFGGGQPRV